MTAEALEEMDRLNLEAIVVVDEEERFKDVVERDRIVSRMIVALAKGARAQPSA